MKYHLKYITSRGIELLPSEEWVFRSPRIAINGCLIKKEISVKYDWDASIQIIYYMGQDQDPVEKIMSPKYELILAPYEAEISIAVSQTQHVPLGKFRLIKHFNRGRNGLLIYVLDKCNP